METLKFSGYISAWNRIHTAEDKHDQGIDSLWPCHRSTLSFIRQMAFAKWSVE